MPWVYCRVTTQLLPQQAPAFAVAQVRGPHHTEGQRRQGSAQQLEEDVEETWWKQLGVSRGVENYDSMVV